MKCWFHLCSHDPPPCCPHQSSRDPQPLVKWVDLARIRVCTQYLTNCWYPLGRVYTVHHLMTHKGGEHKWCTMHYLKTHKSGEHGVNNTTLSVQSHTAVRLHQCCGLMRKSYNTAVLSFFLSVPCSAITQVYIGTLLNKPAAQAAGADPPPLKIHQKAKSTPSVKWP